MSSFLLDTHVWLWLITTPERIGSTVLDQLESAQDRLYLSVASGWEIAIKHRLGKMALPAAPTVFVPAQLLLSGVQTLTVELHHALAVAGLPDHHADPFDRLLVCQAQAERLTLVTADAKMQHYDVPLLSI